MNNFFVKQMSNDFLPIISQPKCDFIEVYYDLAYGQTIFAPIFFLFFVFIFYFFSDKYNKNH